MSVTINFKDVNLIVEGIYNKGEDIVYNCGDGSGYPGSNSFFEIQSIYVEDSNIDIFEFFSCVDLEDIEILVIEKIEA